MPSFNRVQLIGHLGRDPEVRRSPDGAALANLSVATTDVWKDRASGERREVTEWHRAVLFGRQAEIAEEYLRKGSLVFLEGRLRTRKWAGADRQERYTTEVLVSDMQMLGSPDRPASTARASPLTASAPAPAPASERLPLDTDSPF